MNRQIFLTLPDYVRTFFDCVKAVYLYLLHADHASMNVSLYTVAVGVWQAAGRAAAALAKTVVKLRSSYVGIMFDDKYTDLFESLCQFCTPVAFATLTQFSVTCNSNFCSCYATQFIRQLHSETCVQFAALRG